MGRDAAPGVLGSATLGRMRGWHRYAWLGVWVGVGLASDVRFGDLHLVVSLVVGVLIGALWQVLARRDVAGRLTGLALLGLIIGISWALPSNAGQESLTVDLDAALYLLGVACSVVLTEQVLRRRDLGPVTLDMVHAPENDSTPRHSS